MIKFILSIIIILALIGGAVQFVATDESWSLVMNKEIAFSSVKNGAIAIYEFIEALISDADKIKGVDLTTTK
ncbi:conserved hypothetical protein [Abyssogena phaseoliformis symbiont OG214]|uniref:hypothetical protein n=1 Tax=Abyssogena phaseoliformis symbiont TaxID=596095 RepID=UPI0019151DBF|nr:hypothetical protein [Abyssogena phaseoliformis symbiont]MBW5289301.1 hypothetical protein [Candidatus Ruthia sp. Apha_13_S6]BBB22674.1 conserved hypothetical protein [Abyssogena phaseoliformis symbiont OG214]